jgi:GNAT superfamily N-acetyltransferase
VRIRPANEDDLLPLARMFVRTVAVLDQRFWPDHTRVSIEPESRLPVYRHLLRTGAMSVAEDPDPVGFSAAIVRDGVWFLSQLWVLPERHGEGVGAALLDEALAWGRGAGAGAFSVVASPHPAAVTLYLRASMFPLWLQYDLESAVAPPIPEPPPGTDTLGDDDQPWLDELDRAVHGAARPEDHALFRAEAAGLALRRDGHPRGYVYAWPGGKVGPGAVRDPADLPDLLRAARHAAGGPIRVAVPSTNWTALRELLGLGLTPAMTNTFLASRPMGNGARYLSSGGALG